MDLLHVKIHAASWVGHRWYLPFSAIAEQVYPGSLAHLSGHPTLRKRSEVIGNHMRLFSTFHQFSIGLCEAEGIAEIDLEMLRVMCMHRSSWTRHSRERGSIVASCHVERLVDL